MKACKIALTVILLALSVWCEGAEKSSNPGFVVQQFLGPQGPSGEQGAQGPQGPQGMVGPPAVVAFYSGVVAGSAASISFVKAQSLTFKAVSSVLFSPSQMSSSVITSNAGPGFYEVTFGARWVEAAPITASGSALLVLKVDKMEQVSSNPARLSTESGAWASMTVIVQSRAPSPTFEIANSQDSPASMQLLGGDTGTPPNVHPNTSAFLIIKKLQ